VQKNLRLELRSSRRTGVRMSHHGWWRKRTKASTKGENTMFSTGVVKSHRRYAKELF